LVSRLPSSRSLSSLFPHHLLTYVLSCIRNPLRSPTFPGFSSPPQSSAFADIRIRVCFNNTCIMLYYSFMQPLPAFRLVRRVRRRCCCVVVVALLSTFQCGVRRLRSAFGVWCSVFGVWCLVFGVWCLVFGVRRCLVSVVVVSVVAAAAAVVVVPPFGRRRCVGWSLLSSDVFCFLSSLFTLHPRYSGFCLLSPSGSSILCSRPGWQATTTNDGREKRNGGLDGRTVTEENRRKVGRGHHRCCWLSWIGKATAWAVSRPGKGSGFPGRTRPLAIVELLHFYVFLHFSNRVF